MMAVKKMFPSKPRTTLGITRLSIDSDGEQTAAYVPDDIPIQKEAREYRFAEAFVEKFNTQLPLGPTTKVHRFEQNFTQALPKKSVFAIVCNQDAVTCRVRVVPSR